MEALSPGLLPSWSMAKDLPDAFKQEEVYSKFVWFGVLGFGGLSQKETFQLTKYLLNRKVPP